MKPGNTTQWEAFEWAFQQGCYLSPTQQLVLLYLVGHAFYTDDNPESGDVGQVMRAASYVSAIMRGTGLSRPSIRRALTDLQMAGYVQREVRSDRNIHGQQPHRIYVLWDAEALQEGLRDGTRRLPSELLTVPSRPSPRVDERPALTLLKSVQREH